HTSFSRDWSSDVCSSDLHRILNRYDFVAKIGAEFCRILYRRLHIGIELLAEIIHGAEGDPQPFPARPRHIADRRERRFAALHFRSEERRVGKEWKSPEWA